MMRTHGLRCQLLLPIFLLTSFFGVLQSACADAQITLSQDTCFEYEMVMMRITLGRFQGTPEVSAGEAVEVAELPASSARNLRITPRAMLNDQFNYRLIPKTPGDHTIRIRYVDELGDVVDKSVNLKVNAIESNDTVFIEQFASRSRMYVGTQYLLVVRLGIRALEGSRAKIDPTTAWSTIKSISVPFANSAKLPTQIVPTTDDQQWIRPLLRPDLTGFIIESDVWANSNQALSRLTNRSVDLSGRPTVRAFPGKQTEQKVWEYTLSRPVVARRVGKGTIPPAVFSGVVAQTKDEALIQRRYHVRSEPIKLEVVELPTENRPPDFSGAVGAFELFAEVSSEKAVVGEPIRLTLTVTGTGQLEGSSAPSINQLARLNQQLEVQQLSVQQRDDARVFQYRLRGKKPGPVKLVPITFCHFDPDTERYVHSEFPPLDLEFTPGPTERSDRVSDTDLAKSAANPSTTADSKRASSNDARSAASSDEGASKESLEWKSFLIGPAAITPFWTMTFSVLLRWCISIACLVGALEMMIGWLQWRGKPKPATFAERCRQLADKFRRAEAGDHQDLASTLEQVSALTRESADQQLAEQLQSAVHELQAIYNALMFRGESINDQRMQPKLAEARQLLLALSNKPTLNDQSTITAAPNEFEG